MKYCSNCGNKIMKKSSFCTRCGNDLREEVINDTSNEPIIEATNNSINNTTGESIIKDTNDTTNEPIIEATVNSITDTIDISTIETNESISDSIYESINKSIYESINKPTNGSTNNIIHEAIYEPIYEPINESTDSTTQDFINEPNTDPTSESELDPVAKLVTITPFNALKRYIKSPKKLKTTILLCTFIIILVVAIINIGNSLTNPYRIVAKFEKAVATNNSSALAHILYSDNNILKVDSQSIEPLLSSFKSNPAYYNKVIDNLKNDAFSPKYIDNLNIKSDNILTLANKGNFLLFFHNYKIIIKPCYVNITTTVKNVTFSINGTQIGKSDSDKYSKQFGPYIPGNYSIVAKYKGSYVTLNKSYPVSLISKNNGITKLNVLANMTYVNISSDYSNAKIYVDGKDANVKVKDASKFGPVDSSSKIYATYEAGGTTLKSEVYSVSSDETELYLVFQNYNAYGNNVQN
ncbi:hypothetical protein LGK95_18470 [Clostridium algoriphilum]|uniref:zinc ribbon domain-containing protein n=1 Tax=Clostridium algoriphilum TaxID=198347 RepID=UPI001CF178E6|nr:zinc ribbon domain-containing protein [Clostridium algoriphilum]MCB2295470.1 hypothetical protein [Clostridium algoriphilum]